MNPQDASPLTTKLGEFFKGVTRADCELLQTTLAKIPYDTAEAVIRRYAAETATFDRGRLRTLLLEENSRRSLRSSPTPAWRNAKDAEAKVMEDVLSKMSEDQLQGLVEAVRRKRSAAVRFLQKDLLGTEMGRSLIYDEWKNHQSL